MGDTADMVVRLTAQGSGSLVVGGQAREVRAPSLDEARILVRQAAQELAGQLARPVVLTIREPETTWTVQVEPSGMTAVLATVPASAPSADSAHAASEGTPSQQEAGEDAPSAAAGVGLGAGVVRTSRAGSAPSRRWRAVAVIVALMALVLTVGALAITTLSGNEGKAAPAASKTVSAAVTEPATSGPGVAQRAGSGSWICTSGAKGVGVTCWGAAPDGSVKAPTVVPGLEKVSISHLAVGRGWAVATDPDGGVWAWGVNDHGQLGSADAPADGTPVHVGDLPEPATALVAGVEHACAAAGGQVFCFGSSRVGQVGGTVSTAPAGLTRVEGPKGVVSLGTSGYDTWAIDKTGRTWAWGSNQWGQVTPDAPGVASVPVEVSQ